MSDCMKVAIDFVSPENIDRCEKLTKEFREQNQSKVWKEDVLPLRTFRSASARVCEMQGGVLRGILKRPKWINCASAGSTTS
jgi:lysine-specific demethylase 3